MEATVPALRARRLLWLALFVALPVPFWAVTIGIVPPLRMLFLGSIVLGFYLSGAGPMEQLFLGIFFGQMLLWLGGTWLIARLVVRALARDAGVPSRRLFIALGLLLAIALLPVYRLPLSSGATQTNWFGIFN